MDTMSLRLQGRPKHPILMRVLMPVTRFCMAAHLANRDARTVLGPNGHRLKWLLERTHLSRFVIWCIVKDHHNFIGAGGQSIVIRSADNPTRIEKYNYVSAGADPSVLARAQMYHKDDYSAMQKRFKTLVQPTRFGIATLPLRWPFNHLTTFYSSQEQIEGFTDIFTADGTPKTELYTATVRKELTLLAKQARLWSNENKWIDIIGPGNIIVTPSRGELHVKILDIGPYAAEYISNVNPMLGESYKQVFVKRIRKLEMSLPAE